MKLRKKVNIPNQKVDTTFDIKNLLKSTNHDTMIIAGVQGSGKTKRLKDLIKILNQSGNKIHTIERDVDSAKQSIESFKKSLEAIEKVLTKDELLGVTEHPELRNEFDKAYLNLLISVVDYMQCNNTCTFSNLEKITKEVLTKDDGYIERSLKLMRGGRFSGKRIAENPVEIHI